MKSRYISNMECANRAERRAVGFALEGNMPDAETAAHTAVQYVTQAHEGQPGAAHAVAPYAARIIRLIDAAYKEANQ